MITTPGCPRREGGIAVREQAAHVLGGNTMNAGSPYVAILGPLEVAANEGTRLTVGGRKQRELLSLLILHRNRAVSAARLSAELWGEEPPRGAEVTLRSHVSHLRRRLAEVALGDALITGPAGYSLMLAPQQVDAEQFEQRIGLGQEALGLGHPQRASAYLRDALRLWRGQPFAELDGVDTAAAEIARLEEVRLGALEVLAAAELASGRHREVIAELEGLTAAHPFRERFCGQLMVALYRSGRQADALEAYAQARERLADELGLDPGPELQELAQRVLRQDPLLLGEANVPPPPHPATPSLAPVTRSLPDAVLMAEARGELVGRTPELARLDAAWQVVAGGGRALVLLSGEAGIGKSRLVAELGRRVDADGHLVLVGRCETGAPAYHPIGAWLRASAEVSATLADTPPAVLAEVGPLLDGSPGGLEPAPPAAPAAGELALYSAVAFLIGRLAQAGRLLLVVDNAERIDWASSHLLRHLAHRLPGGVLIVVGYRDPPGGRHPPLLDLLGEVSARDLTVRVDLGPVRELEMADLVRDVLPTVDAGIAHRLWQHTGGNPFFAREVARSLADQNAGLDAPVWRVPAGVRDILRHRLESLSERAREVLPVAAVLGTEVDFRLLTQVLHLSEDEVAQALDEAVSAGLLIESGRDWAGSYAFPSQLLRDSLIGEVGGLRLRALHLRAARTLMSGPQVRNSNAAVANHLRAAGPAADPFEAAEWSLRAARDAAALNAWDEAIEHADAAAGLLEGTTPTTRQAEAAVSAALLRLKSSRGLDEAIGLLETALRLYVAAGDDGAAGLAHSRLGGALCLHHSVMDIPRALEHFAAAERLLPAADTVFHLHRGRAQAAMFGLRTDLLLESAERSEAIASLAGRRDLAVIAGWAQAWGAINQGRLRNAVAIWERIWATAHELADPYLGWIAVNAAALVCNAYLGDPQTARSWCRRGLGQPQFTSFRHPHGAVVDQLSLALAAMGELAAARETADTLPDDAVARRMLAFVDGDWERAEQSWATAAAADEAAGDLHDAALNLRWLAMTRRRLGRDLETVVEPLQQALAFSGDDRQVPTELAARAELAALLAVERPAEAEAHLVRCAQILSGGEDWRGAVGPVELARAAVATARGDDAAADAGHARSVEVFSAFRLPWQAAAALETWAHSLTRRGARDESNGRRDRARKIYADLGAADRWQEEVPTG